MLPPITHEDLTFALRLIATNTPATLIRVDAVHELYRRRILERQPNGTLVISELGKAVCARVYAGEPTPELDADDPPEEVAKKSKP
jgi:hypothetical protein